jgi:predicted amidohydrolase YtcJ
MRALFPIPSIPPSARAAARRPHRIARLAAWLFVAATAPAIAAQAPAAPDLLLLHGNVFTSNKAQPHAQAIAIRGERIVAVGSDDEIAATADAHTRRIDLHGRTVIPGINDAHDHMNIGPADFVGVETKNPFDPDWESLQAAIRAATAKAPEGAEIGGPIAGNIFYDPKIDRDALDRLSPDHPIDLWTFDGHARIYNSAMLAKLGIDESIADPIGGRFERDAKGRLTGVLREYAAFMEAERRITARTPDADGIAELRDMLAERARLGITTAQVMPIGFQDSLDRFVRLLEQAQPAIRIRVTPMGMTTPTGLHMEPITPTDAHPAPNISVDGGKWILDGVYFEGGFAPRANGPAGTLLAHGPYSAEGLQLLLPADSVTGILRDALRENRQLQFHVFGRASAKALLDAMDATGGAKVWADKRLRFEHGDSLTPELWQRAKALGVVISQQPSHLDVSPLSNPGVVERLRSEHAQPLRSLLEAGIPLALGSDGPNNPYLGIMLASLHPDRPDEAITREQAVVAYTMGSAYAQFAERDKGSIEPGKLADIAVLSQDIFAVPPQELPGTTSLLTLVGGKVAWAAPEFAQPQP